MSPPRVVAVAPGSPAARAGIAEGDEILAVNGTAPRDLIEWRLLVDEPDPTIDVGRGGIDTTVEVGKRAGEPLGVEVHSALFDRVRTCDNHCEFCFIYQLPPGLRRSLYVKDDDYRLSFLYGNFTTLTRFTEADLERVVSEGLGPLYVSIHATDPEVRAGLLRNRRGATSLRWLRALLDHGVEVHGQVVVCPGVNDGPVLDDTLAGVLDRYPELATLCVVPLGVSRYNSETRMRPHSRAEARAVVDAVEDWQDVYLAALGRRLVFAADEYYLLADRPFPPAEHYGDFPMHEDGVGMVRAFETELLAANVQRPTQEPRPGSSPGGPPCVGTAGSATTALDRHGMSDHIVGGPGGGEARLGPPSGQRSATPGGPPCVAALGSAATATGSRARGGHMTGAPGKVGPAGSGGATGDRGGFFRSVDAGTSAESVCESGPSAAISAPSSGLGTQACLPGASSASGANGNVDGADESEGADTEYEPYRGVRATAEQLMQIGPSRSAPVAILTAPYGARVIEPLLRRIGRPDVRVVTVDNRFFGGNIAVTGLMVGSDLARVLEGEPEGHRYLLPDVCLTQGRFLDGTEPADLPRPVEIVPADGRALRAALEVPPSGPARATRTATSATTPATAPVDSTASRTTTAPPPAPLDTAPSAKPGAATAAARAAGEARSDAGQLTTPPPASAPAPVAVGPGGS